MHSIAGDSPGGSLTEAALSLVKTWRNWKFHCSINNGFDKIRLNDKNSKIARENEQ